MQKYRAFTIIELLVAISIIAVLVGLLFPAIGAVKRHAKQTENGTRVRGITQSMIQYSESHKKFFPGFVSAFSFTPNGATTTGNSGQGQTVEARFWLLLDGSYTDGAAVISPQESKDTWTSGQVRTDNYSYAMLKIASQLGDPTVGQNTSDRFRREEWLNEQNALAPVVSDRLTAGPATVQAASDLTAYESFHDGSSPGNWIGSIGYGDLHVQFAKTPLIETRIAGYANSADTTGLDDIFAQRENTIGGVDGDKNAAMVYESFNIPVGVAQ
jgi:prepilin-type N-terminal cleavage/methylation domain-containing protein